MILRACLGCGTPIAALAAVGGSVGVNYTLPLAPTSRFQADMSASTVDANGRILTLADLQGLANAYAPSLSGKTAPKLLTDAQGRKFLRFEGEQALWIENAFQTLSSQGVAIYMVGRFHRPGPTSFKDAIFALGRAGDGTAVTPNVLGALLSAYAGSANYVMHKCPFAGISSIFGATATPSPVGTGRNGAASHAKMPVHSGLQVMARTPRPNTAGGETLWLNSEYVSTGNNQFGGAATGASIGMDAYGNRDFAFMDLYEIAAFVHPMASQGTNGKDGYHSYAQGDAIVAAMKSAYGIEEIQHTLLLDGDSTVEGLSLINSSPVGVAGVPGDPAFTLAASLGRIMPANWRVLVSAAGGATMGIVGSTNNTLVARRHKEAIHGNHGNLLNIAGGRKVLYFHDQHNDFGEAAGLTDRSNYSAATNSDARALEIYQRFQSYVTTDANSALNRGWEVIVGVAPWSSGATSGKTIIRDKIRAATFFSDFNAAQGQAFAGKLRWADMYSIKDAQGSYILQSYSPTYYLSDQVHPTAATPPLEAALIKRQVLNADPYASGLA